MRLLGYEEEEFLGKFYSQLLDEESFQEWNTVLKNLQDNVHEQTVELKLKSKQGDHLWTEGHYNAFFSNDHYGLCKLLWFLEKLQNVKKEKIS